MGITYTIQVGLSVYKELTARLEEGLTHDDVLRELLSVDSMLEPESHDPMGLAAFSDGMLGALSQHQDGFYSRGLWLPNGSLLRARYKQKQYHAHIRDSAWIDAAGREHTSPSAAATAITRTNVNGLRFWEAKRPTDSAWRRLDLLVKQ